MWRPWNTPRSAQEDAGETTRKLLFGGIIMNSDEHSQGKQNMDSFESYITFGTNHEASISTSIERLVGDKGIENTNFNVLSANQSKPMREKGVVRKLFDADVMGLGIGVGANLKKTKSQDKRQKPQGFTIKSELRKEMQSKIKKLNHAGKYNDLSCRNNIFKIAYSSQYISYSGSQNNFTSGWATTGIPTPSPEHAPSPHSRFPPLSSSDANFALESLYFPTKPLGLSSTPYYTPLTLLSQIPSQRTHSQITAHIFQQPHTYPQLSIPSPPTSPEPAAKSMDLKTKEDEALKRKFGVQDCFVALKRLPPKEIEMLGYRSRREVVPIPVRPRGVPPPPSPRRPSHGGKPLHLLKKPSRGRPRKSNQCPLVLTPEGGLKLKIITKPPNPGPTVNFSDGQTTTPIKKRANIERKNESNPRNLKTKRVSGSRTKGNKVPRRAEAPASFYLYNLYSRPPTTSLETSTSNKMKYKYLKEALQAPIETQFPAAIITSTNEPMSNIKLGAASDVNGNGWVNDVITPTNIYLH